MFTAKEPAPGADGKPASGEKMSQAKELLKVRRSRACAPHAYRDSHTALSSQRYGSAYLITSISLSIVSFGLSYALISAGVDVAALLEKARCVCTRRIFSACVLRHAVR